MRGQGPVVWDRAEGFQVHDAWGNTWIDWSSGVLVANAGHGRPEIAKAICEQANKTLLHNYCFPSEIRARLVEKLAGLAPAPLEKVFLLTTGAETTEAAIKLARTHGRSVGGDKKIGLVSYEGSFHGRTMGAQMIGGIPVPLPGHELRLLPQDPRTEGLRAGPHRGRDQRDLPGRQRRLLAEGIRAEDARLV